MFLTGRTLSLKISIIALFLTFALLYSLSFPQSHHAEVVKRDDPPTNPSIDVKNFLANQTSILALTNSLSIIARSGKTFRDLLRRDLPPVIFVTSDMSQIIQSYIPVIVFIGVLIFGTLITS